MSYSSIVPCTAVVRVEARSMIFIHNVWCNLWCNNFCGKPYRHSYATTVATQLEVV